MRTRRRLSGSSGREPCRGDLLHESAGARPAQRHGAVGYQAPCDPARSTHRSRPSNARSLRPRTVAAEARSRSIGSDEGHPPRRHAPRASRGRQRRRRRGGDRPRARARRAGDQAERPAARPRAAAEGRRAAGDRHRSQRAGRARPHPPRRRPRARGGGHGPLPGREDLHRAADRERLLLRLRVPRRRQHLRRRLRGHRGEDARAHRRRRVLHARGRLGRAGAGALPRRGPGLQGRAHRGPGEERRRRHRLALHQRPVHRPLPRAALAEHEAHRRDQAAVGRGRLLARRRQPPDAHARSTGRRSSSRPSSTRFLEQLEQARARDHRKLGRELGLFTFSPLSPGLDRSGCRRAPRCSTRSWPSTAACSRSAATSRSRRRSSTSPSCGRPRGTGASTRTTSSSRSTRTASSASSR